MSRHAWLQLIGPVALFAALVAAEIAAYALAAHPSSQLLWSVNLELFGLFHRGHDIIGTYVDVAHFPIVCVGLPLLLAACSGLAFRCRFALALASTLSFGYVAFLLSAAYAGERVFAPRMPGQGSGLAIALLGASLLSLFISHMSYLHACRNEEWSWRPIGLLLRSS
jgi:hypothetical protein